MQIFWDFEFFKKFAVNDLTQTNFELPSLLLKRTNSRKCLVLILAKIWRLNLMRIDFFLIFQKKISIAGKVCKLKITFNTVY